jgi:hypothetical protein
VPGEVQAPLARLVGALTDVGLHPVRPRDVQGLGAFVQQFGLEP